MALPAWKSSVRSPNSNPGETIALHFHHTGAAGLNLRDVLHGGYTVVGDTSLKVFAVHIVDKDKPLYDTK